jgi:SagB-type dehydrogenase family enzyme
MGNGGLESRIALMKNRMIENILLLLPGLLLLAMVGTATADRGAADRIMLPEPRHRSHVSVEEALRDRRSVRNYSSDSLTLADIAQLLWSAQGVSDARDRRTAPSAGALYPLELYLVAGNVEALPAGVYQYRPARHTLSRVAVGDKRGGLARAALRQTCVRDAPAVIIMTAVYERTTWKYGDRGKRYVHMESGHAAQNIYLQAVPLGLGTVTVGAFSDGKVKQILDLPENEVPLYLMPVGKTR